jgi:hypothetical protein
VTHALDEAGLARPQLTLKADHVPGLQQQSQARTEAPGLRRTMAYEVKGVFVQDWHGSGLSPGYYTSTALKHKQRAST